MGVRRKGVQASGAVKRRVSVGRKVSPPSIRRASLAVPVRVSITQQFGAQPLVLLGQALEAAGFWRHIERARRAVRIRRNRFRIIIKPDLDFYDPLTPGGTDPVLVEHLIDLLHDNGFTNVAVLDGRNDPDSWLHNRDALVVPELVGYRFATSKGRAYEIVASGAAPAPEVPPGDQAPPAISAHSDERQLPHQLRQEQDARGQRICAVRP